jgi:hypothetical protein
MARSSLLWFAVDAMARVSMPCTWCRFYGLVLMLIDSCRCYGLVLMLWIDVAAMNALWVFVTATAYALI